jgi:formylglycine-generating enzyme required for sulfatase activity
VLDFLIELAWLTVAQGSGNFTGVLAGEPFRQWRREKRTYLSALKQVDVVTEHALLGDYDREGLAWRHRSFSEYFAGLQLVRVPVEQSLELVQRHGRDPRWSWVFRFALSESAHLGKSASYGTEPLARDLIRFGNPFVVFDAIERDGLELPDYLDRLCRWLVHRDWDLAGRNYTNAWQESDAPQLDRRWIEVLESLFDRRYRDSRCLHPAWELVVSSDEAWAAGIRQRFLSEFPAMLADESCAEHTSAVRLLRADAFVRCPPDSADDGEPFWIGSPSGRGEGNEHPQHEVRVRPFWLQQTPVTNIQYELFDPSHRIRRDDSGAGADHPAVFVSWYMASLYWVWLGNSARLPTEAEWEYACRAGTDSDYSFGDDADQLADYAWFAENSGGKTQPVGLKKPNVWGLYDMHGNVWEWCSDWYDRDYYQQFAGQVAVDPTGPTRGSVRVIRGGSWHGVAGNCRAAFRIWYVPSPQDGNLGFRLARAVS